MTDETKPEGTAAPEELKPEVVEAEAKPENTEKSADSENETDEAKNPESSEKVKASTPERDKRINRLSRTVRELQRELETERSSRQQVSEVKETKGEPKVEDYDDYGKYAKDVAKWEVKQATGEFSKSQSEAVNRVLVEKARDDFRERLETFSEKHDDFDELVEEVGPIIKGAALESLIESKHGPEIIYHLAKNPEEAERISKLSPLAAAREIGRIEARLEEKPVKKTTSAPPPAKTVSGNSTANNTPSDNDSTETWIKKEAARMHAKRTLYQ